MFQVLNWADRKNSYTSSEEHQRAVHTFDVNTSALANMCSLLIDWEVTMAMQSHILVVYWSLATYTKRMVLEIEKKDYYIPDTAIQSQAQYTTVIT